MGQAAETAAANYLVARGYRVMARNWKTRRCEIDIVASRGRTLYLVEVKYRSNDTHGDGLAAITPTKLRQMTFAAQIFNAKYDNYNLRLMAIAVTGDKYVVTDQVVLE